MGDGMTIWVVLWVLTGWATCAFYLWLAGRATLSDIAAALVFGFFGPTITVLALMLWAFIGGDDVVVWRRKK